MRLHVWCSANKACNMKEKVMRVLTTDGFLHAIDCTFIYFSYANVYYQPHTINHH